MDNLMVIVLMQFYFEIEEVESSERSGVEGVDDIIEINFVYGVSKVVEESRQIKSSKSYEIIKDMDVEFDCEYSYKGVFEDEEVLEIGYVVDLVYKTIESFDRGYKLEGEIRELEFIGMLIKES